MIISFGQYGFTQTKVVPQPATFWGTFFAWFGDSDASTIPRWQVHYDGKLISDSRHEADYIDISYRSHIMLDDEGVEYEYFRLEGHLKFRHGPTTFVGFWPNLVHIVGEVPPTKPTGCRALPTVPDSILGDCYCQFCSGPGEVEPAVVNASSTEVRNAWLEYKQRMDNFFSTTTTTTN